MKINGFQILSIFVGISGSSLRGKYFEYLKNASTSAKYSKYFPLRLLPDIPIKTKYLEYISGLNNYIRNIQ